MLLRAELAAKDERVDLLQEERERERRQLTERISELRDQLAQSEEERREKDRQLTALLSDHQKKMAPLPWGETNPWAATTEHVHPPPQSRFFGLVSLLKRRK
jgi:hypothetical protein